MYDHTELLENHQVTQRLCGGTVPPPGRGGAADRAPRKTAKDTNARVTRWFVALQDYRFQVVHRPGRAHGNADAVSRRDACLGLAGGTPGLLLRMGVCGNPTPSAMDISRISTLSAGAVN